MICATLILRFVGMRKAIERRLLDGLCVFVGMFNNSLLREKLLLVPFQANDSSKSKNAPVGHHRDIFWGAIEHTLVIR